MTGAGEGGEVEGLLPCPFCDGAAERVDIEEGENAGGSCVCCTQCQASSNVEFEFKENFVSNWNRRAAPARSLTDTSAGGDGEALDFGVQGFGYVRGKDLMGALRWSVGHLDAWTGGAPDVGSGMVRVEVIVPLALAAPNAREAAAPRDGAPEVEE